MKRSIIAVVAICLLASMVGLLQTARAAEVTLSADADLGSGGALGSIAPTGTGTTADPYVYAFSSGGLDVGSFKSFANTGNSYTLNLAGFDITGVSGGVSLSSSRSAYGAAVPAGNLTILNAGNIAVGAIETYSNASYWGQNNNSPAGNLTIGDSGQRVGNIRTDAIDVHATFNGSSGLITIFGGGDVLIQTSGGTAGDVNGANWTGAKGMNVNHDGAFNVGTVMMYTTSYANSAGSIVFNGDGLGNGASGAFTATSLQTYSGHADTSNLAGDISISGYQSITVTGDILAQSLSADKWNTDPHGGDLTASAAGDIRLLGQINLATSRGTAYSGHMELTATNGGGIELGDQASPGAVGLDLNGFEYLYFNSSRMTDGNPTTNGESVIYDNILNFAPGGDASTPNAQLRVEQDVDIIYYYHDDTVNASLFAGNDFGLDPGTYYIQSNGAIGLGLLAPLPTGAAVPEPMTLSLLALGGIGLIARASRRRRAAA
ncbi:MAG: hypothetical protein BIFFINMI_01718 [Phycisphaerae bacterium]|nr:hypothetical protein [Phycisphaerae bacterium]